MRFHFDRGVVGTYKICNWTRLCHLQQPHMHAQCTHSQTPSNQPLISLTSKPQLIIYLIRLHGWLRNFFYAFLFFGFFYSIYDVIDMM